MVAFVAIVATGSALLLAAVWLLDARSVPALAGMTLVALALCGLVTGLPIILLRARIGNRALTLAGAAAGGCLFGWVAMLGPAYRNPCAAIGWRYEEGSDLLIPGISSSDPRGCSRIGRYRRYAGIWHYGEWGQWFSPADPASAPEGALDIDEAAANLTFDTMLHQRPSRYAGRRIYLVFRGNMLVPARHAAADRPVYDVRDVVAARLLPEGDGTTPVGGAAAIGPQAAVSIPRSPSLR